MTAEIFSISGLRGAAYRAVGPKPSSYWRDRAEEASAQLLQMNDPHAIKAMRLVVENYERLAAITASKEAAGRERPRGAKRR
jgi:hypothetical protein